VKAFNHFPFTIKDINNIFILKLISYQQVELIIFWIIPLKKEKDLIRDFSLFNFSLIEKGLLSFLLSK
jgi:hypothetical protein